MELVKSTFNRRLVNPERLKRQFGVMASLADRISVKRLSYPRAIDRLPDVRGMVLADLARDARSVRSAPTLERRFSVRAKMAVSFSDRVRVAPDVLFRLVGEEAVLVNLQTERYLGLNPVGTRMWSVLSSASSIQAAYDELLQRVRG